LKWAAYARYCWLGLGLRKKSIICGIAASLQTKKKAKEGKGEKGLNHNSWHSRKFANSKKGKRRERGESGEIFFWAHKYTQNHPNNRDQHKSVEQEAKKKER
jgi:hypothetical protein